MKSRRKQAGPDSLIDWDVLEAFGFAGRRILTVSEIAKAMLATPQHIINLVDRGRLGNPRKTHKSKASYQIPAEAFVRFIKSRSNMRGK